MRPDPTPSSVRGRAPRPDRPPAGAVRVFVVMILAIGLLLLAAGLAATAQEPSAMTVPSLMPAASSGPGRSPGAADPLVAGLLQAADLPAGMAPTGGVQEGTDYDIDDAAFRASDGIRIVSRTWGMSPATGPSVVFDFRMQFPTPEAASAYLAAAMPTLSEATTTGLTPLTGVPAMGDETYGFGRDTQGTDGPVTIRAYLFRVGSVVAKVVAGGAGVSGDQAQAIAQAAAERVVAAGQPAPGSPRPRPTPSPVASQPAPLPSGDLTALLLAHIPADIAPTCTPDSQRLWEGEIVTLDCRPADADVTVTYSGFDSADHMGAAYQASLDTIDLSNLTASCDTGTWSGAYQVDGQDVGQTTCWPQPNGHAIMWSDDRLAILSVAVSPSLDAPGLYQWWLGAGPNP